MGTVYHGPYADKVGYDDHEGYAATVLPDGSDTATTTAETETTGYRAACSCEWRGTEEYPATEAGEDDALDEWEQYHLKPMVRSIAGKHAVPAVKLLDFIQDLRGRLETTPESEGMMLTERSRGVVDVIESLGHLLDYLAEQEKAKR